jgi:hypothetical protein
VGTQVPSEQGGRKIFDCAAMVEKAVYRQSREIRNADPED